MDQEANNQLLKVSWYPITINNSTNNHHENNCIYYVKYLMGETDYRLLITDLRNVWYNAANAQDLYEQASHHRLIIENNQQLRQLLRQVEAFLQDLENNCEIIKEEQSLKIKCSLQQKIGTLSWTFLCELLPSSTGVSSMDAPTVLYNHFILPMFMLIQNQPG
ncbi:hypothetical protein BDA99DRAFT_267706 [Phascolomyces articulosus]|uniref:Non-homologous end-joining factor 1 n=1 Tax=Phascolomyces articulosus TaxID=60185 RepID=A0AAD5P7V3_9FUNG|nr:hypothetical protein BDA99DRAFT_267706 [Phascolomyces articulosus]